MRLAYRVAQARSMASARMSQADVADALGQLPPALRPLFLLMSERDQRHAVRVLHRLDAAGPAPDVLRQAALLHDVGKVPPSLGIPGRSLVVLADVSRTTWLLARVPRFGRRLRRYLAHPEEGARMLREAGADPALVEIVAEHQARSPRHPETLRLQAVDGRE